jgi:hypothetical protein
MSRVRFEPATAATSMAPVATTASDGGPVPSTLEPHGPWPVPEQLAGEHRARGWGRGRVALRGRGADALHSVGRRSDREDELPADVSRLDDPVRIGGLLQRVGLLDLDPQRPCGAEVEQLAQLGGVGLGEQPAHA